MLDPGTLRSALDAVATLGFARIARGLDDARRAELIAAAPARFAPLEPEIGPVRQGGEIAEVPVDGSPAVLSFARELAAAVRGTADPEWGLDDLRFTDASYMRFRPDDAGISPHRDHKRYRRLVAVVSLEGQAPFAVVNDRKGEDVVARWTSRPGDVVLLRGTGFAGLDDGRPMHTVGPSEAGVRLFTDDHRSIQSARVMRLALEYAKAFGVVVCQHAQDDTLAEDAQMHEGHTSALLGLRGAPAEAESVTVARDLALAALTGGRYHVTHVSAAETVRGYLRGFANREQTLLSLQDEVATFRNDGAPEALRRVRERYKATGFTDDQWKAFMLGYTGNVDEHLTSRLETTRESTRKWKGTAPARATGIMTRS